MIMTVEKGLVAVYSSGGGLEFLTDNTMSPPRVYSRTRYTIPTDFPEDPIRDLLFGADPEIVRARYEGLNLQVVKPRSPRATPDGLEDSDEFPPKEPQSIGFR